MNKSELKEILKSHKRWLKNKNKGKRAYLHGANLFRANLRGTDLSGADLSGTDLSGANLSNARLCNADLSGADLHHVNLRGADLSDANLCNAFLCSADLSGASLCGTNLHGADIDFSCLPLCCGSLGAKFDRKHYVQFLYHILKSFENNNLIDDDFKQSLLTECNINIANQFHRVNECGAIESFSNEFWR